MTENKITTFRNQEDLKMILHKNYTNQIKNYLGDEKKAMKFLSSVMGTVQKIPKLLECEPTSVINSFMTMAQLGLMPSDVSGEAYVLPYGGKAQFQLGYQGIVTLAYGAGVQAIRSDVIRANDLFTYENGQINHKIDIMKSNSERGEIIGAYAIATVNGIEIAKAMNIKDIVEIGKKFSKSFSTDFSPWNEKNDPERWMFKKTVLKQLAKMLPKNEKLFVAISEDNKDSRISEVKDEMSKKDLSMGNFEIKDEEKDNKKVKGETTPSSEDSKE